MKNWDLYDVIDRLNDGINDVYLGDFDSTVAGEVVEDLQWQIKQDLGRIANDDAVIQAEDLAGDLECDLGNYSWDGDLDELIWDDDYTEYYADNLSECEELRSTEDIDCQFTEESTRVHFTVDQHRRREADLVGQKLASAATDIVSHLR